jgi:hypothetical protein
MPPSPRSTRWTLGVAAALFAAAGLFSVLTVVTRAPLPAGVPDGTPELGTQLRDAEAENRPEFDRRFGDARDALATAGWQLGPAGEVRFECWAQAEETVCRLFTDVAADTPVPPPAGRRVAAIDRIFATTHGALADGGWRCSRPVTRIPAGAPRTTCTAGDAELELVAAAPAGRTGGAHPRLAVELHLSQEAYRSGGRRTSV